MEWNNKIRILEERDEYSIFYSLNGGVGVDFKFYFTITVGLHNNKTKDVYYEYKYYDSETVPTTIKDIEGVLKKLSNKLIKRMKKDNV